MGIMINTKEKQMIMILEKRERELQCWLLGLKHQTLGKPKETSFIIIMSSDKCYINGNLKDKFPPNKIHPVRRTGITVI